MRRDIITMKTGIFVALAALGALAFAIFAVPEAHGDGKDGKTLHFRFFGSTVVTSDQDGVPTPVLNPPELPFTAVQNGIAKGSGSAVFTGQTVFNEGLASENMNCDPEQQELQGNFTGVLVLTFKDGSILDLTYDPGSFCCFNGAAFLCDFGGSVAGGEGRLEDATGTWNGAGRAQGSRVVFESWVDLDGFTHDNGDDDDDDDD